MTLRRHVTDDAVVVEFDDSAAPADVRQFVSERDLFAITRLAPLLVGGLDWLYHREEIPVCLEVRDVDWASEVAELFAGTIVSVRVSARFALKLPAPLLIRPMPAADPLTAASCVAQCEELLESRRRRRGLATQVRARLIRDPGDVPSMATVADELCCTERTLHRRLAAENTSYRTLLDEVRETLALALLDTGLTVEETARHLGYSETPAFTRAFVRWRGDRPSMHRRKTPPW
jgi:AraC-like DNA-binding protein